MKSKKSKEQYVHVLSTNLIDAFLVVRTDTRKKRKKPNPYRLKVDKKSKDHV